MLRLQTVAGVDDRDQQFVIFAGGLSHVGNPLAHGGTSAFTVVGLDSLLQGIISVERVQQVVHLLVEETSIVSLGLLSSSHAVGTDLEALDLLQVLVRVAAHVLVGQDKSALDHDAALLSRIRDGILKKSANDLVEPRSIVVDHEHWVALDVRETDVLRG